MRESSREERVNRKKIIKKEGETNSTDNFTKYT